MPRVGDGNLMPLMGMDGLVCLTQILKRIENWAHADQAEELISENEIV